MLNASDGTLSRSRYHHGRPHRSASHERAHTVTPGEGRRDRSAYEIQVHVLGPLAVRRRGTPLRLGSRRQRGLLGLLAVSAGMAASKEAIIEALWGEEPAPTAVPMIQSYVSRLRRTLSPSSAGHPASSPVVATPNGYRLAAGQCWLDAESFEWLAHQAQKAASQNDAFRACELYQSALELWRDEPLCDLDMLREHPAVLALSRRRTTVTLEFAAAATDQGWPDRVLPHLQGLLSREPFNERAGAWLMLALAGCGQQAAALAIFDELRHRLDEQLGVDPGAELTEAQQRVLRHHVTSPGLAGPAGPAATAAPGCQLPPAVADFTGRDSEISQLVTALVPDAGQAAVPVVLISGLPGVGKTSLALQAAHRLRESFPGGQLWISLDGASSRPRDPAAVLGELLRILGVHGSALPDSVGARAALYRSRLAGQRVLVLVDDAESAAQVEPLLPGTSGSAVIITSRSPMAAPPGARLFPLRPLTAAEAADLLGRIAGPDRVAADGQAAAELAGACGMLPLAVRIAGARLAARPSWPISVLTSKLSDHLRRLDELQAGNMSVRASVASSYEALDERARQAFCLLGMLGPLEVAEWVIAALLGEPDAADVVAELADKSLLTPTGVDATGQPRYRLHDLLRDYAAERLAGEPRAWREAALDRVLTAWLQLATLAGARLPREPYFPRQADDPVPGPLPADLAASVTADPVAWLTAERLTLVTAAEGACASGRYQLAVRLGRALAGFHYLHILHEDAKRIWSAVLAAAESSGDQLTATQARLRTAAVHCGCGQHAEAIPAVNACVSSLEQYDDPVNLTAALYWRAVCALNLGSFEDACHYARRALALSQRTGNQHGELLAIHVLGLAEARLPDTHADGITHCERAVSLAQEIGEPTCEREVLYTLTHVNSLAGRHSHALELCAKGMGLDRCLPYPAKESIWLGTLGDAHYGLGHYEEAEAAYLQALGPLRDQFLQRHYALCELKLGITYRDMGRIEEANAHLQEGLRVFRELRLRHYEKQAEQALKSCQAGQFHHSAQPPAQVPSGPA